MEGHITIQRKILEWEWYKDANTFRVFMHLLITANWKTGRFQGVEIERGQRATSYQMIASETGLTVKNVRTAIEHLKKTGELAVNRHPKFSVFTIKNYNLYQSTGSQPAYETAVNGQSTGSQLATIEERNKEINNNISSDEDICQNSAKNDIYITIRELYNSVCGSYPRLVKMSESRKRAIKARINAGYTVDDFKTLFEKAEASDFLKGKNNRDWRATFDWLICDRNMAKVLDGNYDKIKREVQKQPKKNQFNNFHQRDYDFDDLERQLVGR